MELNKYQISLFQKDAYWFMSSGKQGTIYKGVLFQQLPQYNWFNLAMGDIDPKSGKIEFDELTGNGDARKVFATIAEIVKRILKIILIGRAL
jgi:hypothetical protein